MANTNEESLADEKLLFVVDMVKFFLNKRHPHLTSAFEQSNVCRKADSCRIRVQNCFSDNIKKKVGMIDETVRKDFEEIKDKGKINESSLMEYNEKYKCHFDKGQAQDFLMYCARLTAMACFFFQHEMKDLLSTVVHLIQSAFPKDKDECNLIWGRSDNATAPSDLTSSETKASSSSSTINSESYSVAELQNLTSGSSAESFTAAGSRKPSDLTSSETEESSSSSTINSESYSVAESQNLTSASSAESSDLTSSETEESSNSSINNSESYSVAVLQNLTPASSAEPLTAAGTRLNVSSMECTEYPQSKESSTTTEDPDVKVENTSEPSCSSSIRSVLPFESKCPKYDYNAEKKIRNAMGNIEGESSEENIPVKSPSKSCLGKRSRKGHDSELSGTSSVSTSGSGVSDESDSETEIKKPKRSRPDTSD